MKTIFLTIMLNICMMAYCQSTFRTQEGHILAYGTFKGHQFIAESHKLLLILNNDFRKLSGSISLKELETGIPEIDSVLIRNATQISFEGDIPVDFLNWSHPEINVDIPINIILNGNSHSDLLKVSFNHLDNTYDITCVLSGRLEIDLTKYSDEFFSTDFSPGLEILLMQLVLRKK